MTELLKSVLLFVKNFSSGSISFTLNGVLNSINENVIDLSAFGDTTTLLGVSVPTFLIYLILFGD